MGRKNCFFFHNYYQQASCKRDDLKRKKIGLIHLMGQTAPSSSLACPP
ncbi:hypothetical protein AtDm6_1738 [Acetobacter tropicalis]|uniref:Uncharacterized protein n=1 Tax=Acetobacter tropicalis TaxID=104102 RepID=A0A095B2Z8_9PROT|nr:hypothetical protein AtDm6_1738 [Acetobacter tropicalis]